MNQKHCRWPNGILLTACLVSLTPSQVLAEDCVAGAQEESVYQRRIPGKAAEDCEKAPGASNKAPQTSQPSVVEKVAKEATEDVAEQLGSSAKNAEPDNIEKTIAPVAEQLPSGARESVVVSGAKDLDSKDIDRNDGDAQPVPKSDPGYISNKKSASDNRTAGGAKMRALDNPVRLKHYKHKDVKPTVFKDRWRIVEHPSLGYKDNRLDPYNRNTLKADVPIHDDWFFNLGIISDTVYELRDVPTPVGNSTTESAGSLDVFGGPEQSLLNQNLLVEFVYYKGDTTFKPPDYEYRLITVFNHNYTELDEVLGVNVDPNEGKTRTDNHVGIQAAFVDIHLRNVSDRYDFDSVRFGIQPFSSDFRGFLFQDNQLGVRLFGNRDDNIFQYNLAVFQRLEKDTNSGLNDVSADIRDDTVFFANVYWQDLWVKGFFSQLTLAHNINREDSEFYFDNNGFIARPASLGREAPRGYDVTYLGYNGDGHIGRLNLTTSAYYAFGSVDPGVFVDQSVDVSATFLAAELSVDFDWIRPKISFLHGSGDDDPFDDTATGFDAIFENPQFAGADNSYWIRQAVPLIGGGRVALSSRNGVLNNLRSSKEQGQSNFTNPGIFLLGVGVDMDILPELRFSAQLNHLEFDETAVLEVARNQGNIDTEIGQDLSLAFTYRPLMSQNIVARFSYAFLKPGAGYRALFGDEKADYLLFNLILAY